MVRHWRVLTIFAFIVALLAIDAGTAMGQEALICRKRDKILSGEGTTTVLGPKDDVVNAGDGNDVLKGGKGDDILNGGRGNDKVYGGPGNDIVFVESLSVSEPPMTTSKPPAMTMSWVWPPSSVSWPSSMNWPFFLP